MSCLDRGVLSCLDRGCRVWIEGYCRDWIEGDGVGLRAVAAYEVMVTMRVGGLLSRYGSSCLCGFSDGRRVCR